MAGSDIVAKYLSQHEGYAPAIKQQMMVAPDEVAPLGCAFHQRETHQRRDRKIKAALPVQFEQLVQPLFMLVNGNMRPVQAVEDRRGAAMDYLHRFFKPLPGK